MKRKAFAQIPLMIGLLIMAIAVPVATRLVQMNQDNRNKAASSTSGACTEGNLGTLCTNGDGKTCQLHRNSDCTTSCTDNCGAGFASITATAYPSLVVPTTPSGATTRPGVATEAPTIPAYTCNGTCVTTTSCVALGSSNGSGTCATGKKCCNLTATATLTPKPTVVPTACTCVGGRWTGTVALCGHSLGYACTATCVAATCNSECITNGATSGSCNSSNQCMCSTVPTLTPTSTNCWLDGISCLNGVDCNRCCNGSYFAYNSRGVIVYYCGNKLDPTPTVVPSGWTGKYCPGNSGVEAICDIGVPPSCSATGCHPGQCTGSLGYAHCINNEVTVVPTSASCTLGKWDCGNNGVYHCESSGGVLTNVLKQGCGTKVCVKATDGSSATCLVPTATPTIRPTATPTGVGACSGALTDASCKGLDPGAPCGAGRVDSSYICTTSSTVVATSGLNCTCTSTEKWVCCKTSTGLYVLESACSDTETLTNLSASKCVNPTAVPTTPRTTTNPTSTPKPTTKPTDVVCKISVGKVYSLNDFSIWRSEYVAGSYGSVTRSTWNSDFDCDGKVTLNDFSIWRTNYIKSL